MFRLSIIILAIIIVSCTSEPKVQSEFYGFKNESWAKNSPLEFTFNIKDTSTQYILSGNLRYTKKFNFNALNLAVSLLSPSGSSRFQGIGINLKNEDGSMRGEAIDDYLEINFPIYKNLKFNEKGNWVLNVMHKMPVDITRGLNALEFELEQVQ